MKLHNEFISAILDEMRVFLLKNHLTLSDVPASLADEVKQIATRIKKTADATQLRNYLLDYIGLTSSIWRTIAPYTNYNKLRCHLETVVNSPQFSPQAIQIAQISSVHEYYLEKQKELIEPLQIEIHSLRGLCQSLQSNVTSLREENQRLRVENDFFMKELVTMQTQATNKPISATHAFSKTPPTSKPTQGDESNQVKSVDARANEPSSSAQGSYLVAPVFYSFG